MNDYKEYEKKVKENEKINNKYLDEFEKWLNEKKLTEKTINNHVSNVDLYINNYLVYYEVIPMEKGGYELDEFFSDWFIRKCTWSTGNATKLTVASLKKFYQCMNELNHIEDDIYKHICKEIKENIEDWIDKVEDYNSECYNFF